MTGVVKKSWAWTVQNVLCHQMLMQAGGEVMNMSWQLSWLFDVVLVHAHHMGTSGPICQGSVDGS